MGGKIVPPGWYRLQNRPRLIRQIIVADLLQAAIRIEMIVEIAPRRAPFWLDHLQMIKVEAAIPELEAQIFGKPGAV